MTELPIACSLTARELPARLADLRELGRSALVRAEISDRRAELRFFAGARERVRDFAAAEARCCPFLTLQVADEPGGDVLLSIEAPPDAEPVLRELVAAFTATMAG